MSPASGEKICVVCGEDCAGKPRVKDPKGRYYCRDCYEEAQQRKEQSESAAPHDQDDHDPAADPVSEKGHQQEAEEDVEFSSEDKKTADFGGSLLDDLDVGEEPDAPSKPSAPAASGEGCPQCGAAIDPGAVLCVQCGYNFKTGKAISAQVAADEDEDDDDGDALDADVATRWPSVLGVLSIIFGGLFLIGALINSVFGALALENPMDVIGIVLGLLIAAAIWIWPVWGGYGLVQRQPIGPRILRFWSLAVLILGVLILLGAVVGVVLLGDAINEAIAEASGGDGGGLGEAAAGVMIAAVLAVMLPILAWPLFLLLWLRRAVIQREVTSWGSDDSAAGEAA